MDRRGSFRRGAALSSRSSRAGKRPLTPAQEEERRQCIRSDGARKRAMLHYIKHGAEIPKALLVRETPEFDARIAAEAEASSSRAPPVREEGSSSRAPRTPPPPPQRPAGSVVTEADYFGADDEASFERLLDVIAQRSVAEAEEEAQRRRRDAEIDAVFEQQGLAADRQTRGKKLDRELERAAQNGNFVDLVSESSGVSYDSDDEYDFGDEL